MKKICIITGSRAEYGLLYWLIKKVKNDSDLTLQLIATGMHLSHEFGLTYKEIEKEFKIDKKIEILLSSDSSISIAKSMGLALISFSEALLELKPDMILILGDRFEIFSVASAAMVSGIPIAHIHGGERTEGVIDEAMRHGISKMSHLHFTAMEEYRNRVIQLGEQPSNVFNVGALGIEAIRKMKLLSKGEFEASINFKLKSKNILITFHPETSNTTVKSQFNELLSALNELKDTGIIFTKANSDVDGRVINKMIDAYVARHLTKSIAFQSLGQLRYFSALSFMDAVVGNSSSGIIEAPSFNIGTVNIGNRQYGRVQSSSVINCKAKKLDILNSINMLYSEHFQHKLKTVVNPYGDGFVSDKIINVIKKTKLKNILNKTFYDLPNVI